MTDRRRSGVTLDESITDEPGTAVSQWQDVLSEGNTAKRSAATASGTSLVAVCGLPGVGKSTVAEQIADHHDAHVFRTDVIRKELFAEPAYSKTETETVYATLLERSIRALRRGDSVVLDATFSDRGFRAETRSLAVALDIQFQLVKVACNEPVVERRIERRDGISDADFDVYQHLKRTFDDITSDHLVIDNSLDASATRSQVDRAFGTAADP